VLAYDVDQDTYEKEAQKLPILVSENEPTRLVIFNSLGQHRQEIIRVKIRNLDVQVLDAKGGVVLSQLSPVWNDSTISNYHYMLEWVAQLKPMAMATFTLKRVKEKSNISRWHVAKNHSLIMTLNIK
jgi:hypothetical protein